MQRASVLRSVLVGLLAFVLCAGILLCTGVFGGRRAASAEDAAGEAAKNAAASTVDQGHPQGEHEGWVGLTQADFEEGGTYAESELPGGNYYLAEDITLTVTNVVFQGGSTITLCLNGKMLRGNGNGSVVTVQEHSDFTLCDCDTTTQHPFYGAELYTLAVGAYDDYMQDVQEAGSADGVNGAAAEYQWYMMRPWFYKFDDGTEEWDTAYNAAHDMSEYGLEYLEYDQKIAHEDYPANTSNIKLRAALTGGVITGGAAIWGAGVRVGAYSTATINGGNIAGNTLIESGNAIRCGGGFYVAGYSTVTINGGTIAGNTGISNTTALWGYGASFYNCVSVEVNGGYFLDNGAQKDNTYGNTNSDGGNMYIDAEDVSIRGGLFMGGMASRWGGGCHVYDFATAEVTGGVFAWNTQRTSGLKNGVGGGLAFYGYDVDDRISEVYLRGGTAIYNYARYGGGGVGLAGGNISFYCYDFDFLYNYAHETGSKGAGGGLRARSYAGTVEMQVYGGTFYGNKIGFAANCFTTSGSAITYSGDDSSNKFEVYGGYYTGGFSTQSSAGGYVYGGYFTEAARSESGNATLYGFSIPNGYGLTEADENAEGYDPDYPLTVRYFSVTLRTTERYTPGSGEEGEGVLQTVSKSNVYGTVGAALEQLSQMRIDEGQKGDATIEIGEGESDENVYTVGDLTVPQNLNLTIYLGIKSYVNENPVFVTGGEITVQGTLTIDGYDRGRSYTCAKITVAEGGTLTLKNVSTDGVAVESQGNVTLTNTDAASVTSSGAALTINSQTAVTGDVIHSVNGAQGSATTLNNVTVGGKAESGALTVTLTEVSVTNGVTASAAEAALNIGGTTTQVGGSVTHNGKSGTLSGGTIVGALTFTAAENYTISGGTVQGALTLNAGGTFNVTGGAFGDTVQNEGTLTVTSSTFEGMITNTGTLAVNGGTFEGVVTNTGTLTVTGGTFAAGVMSSSSVTISGGYFGTNTSLSNTVSVTGGYFAAGAGEHLGTAVYGNALGESRVLIDLSRGDGYDDPDYLAEYPLAVYMQDNTTYNSYSIENAEMTYDGAPAEAGTDVTVTGNAHGASVAYTYTGTASAQTPVSGTGLPQNAGTYTVTAVFAGGDASLSGSNKTYYPNGGGSASFTLTIEKAKAVKPDAPAVSGTITYGDRLSVLTLTEGWQWEDGTIVPHVEEGGVQYTVIYTQVDLLNYDWSAVEDFDAQKGIYTDTVSVTVDPRTPSTPTGMTAVYGQTLSEIAFPAAEGGVWTWRWENTVIDDVGDIFFSATFTPSSADYQAVASVSVALNVARATLTDNTQNVTATYDGQEKSVVLDITGFVNGETMQTAAGLTIEYGTEEGVYTGDASLLTGFNVADSRTIYYRITSDHYETIEGAVVLNIEGIPITANVTITGWTEGEAGKVPQITGNIGGAEVSYRYTGTTIFGEQYDSNVAPTEAGTYTVTVTIAPIGNYAGGTASSQFTIEPSASGGSPTPIGAIIGIVIAAVALAGGVTVFVVLVAKKKKNM